MRLAEFERTIGCRLTLERSGKRFWRCYFRNVLYTDRPGPSAVAFTIIGAGPNPERTRRDFVQKIRGKTVRVTTGPGAFAEFPAPLILEA